MNLADSDINPYLQQEVLSASPIRLRFMLIQRAKDLTTLVGQLWEQGEVALGQQWLLRIREIFGELLEGVKDPQNPASTPISDFYVFLLQMALDIERTQNRDRLEVLHDLLAIEAETWQMVLEKVSQEAAGGVATPPVAIPSFGSLDSAASGSFSLEV